MEGWTNEDAGGVEFEDGSDRLKAGWTRALADGMDFTTGAGGVTVGVLDTIDTGLEAVGVGPPDDGGIGKDFSLLTTTGFETVEDGFGGSLNPLLRSGGERESSSS